jgi:hypothetical protein
MLRRCAWCGLMLGYSEPLDDRSVTHGICLRCADRMLDEFRQIQAAEKTFAEEVPDEEVISAITSVPCHS